LAILELTAIPTLPEEHWLAMLEELKKTGIYYDDEYDEGAPLNAGSDKTIKFVDFVIRSHLNADMFPKIRMERFEKSATSVEAPMYLIDDETAIKVGDGDVQVISEGQWKLLGK
jgi:hypothetical protein